MNPNDNILNLLKKEAQNSIKLYNKTIPPSSITLEQLIDKASEIDKKISSTKPNLSDLPIPSDPKYTEHTPKNHDLFNFKEHSTHPSPQYLDFDSFRKSNPFIPKLHITSKKDKKRNSSTSLIPSYGGIMSLYASCSDDDCAFTPIDRADPVSEAPSHMDDYCDSAERNDVDYDKKAEPFFFTNRYVEYEYEDKGDKLYDENEVMRRLVEKNAKNRNGNEYVCNGESKCLRTFLDLMLLQKEEHCERSMFRRDKMKYEMKPVSVDVKTRIQNEISNASKINLDGEYMNYFLARNVNEYEIAKQMEIAENENNDNGKDNKKKTHVNNVFIPFNRNASDVSFKINVQGEISKKKGRNNSKQSGMIVNGTIASWYAMNSKKEFEEKKGWFDIRDINFSDNNIQHNAKDSNNNSLIMKGIIEGTDTKQSISQNKQNVPSHKEEEFEVKKIMSKGKPITKSTIFSSRRMLEFNNKTFKHFFHQLQQYYNDFITNIDGASYNILKFLSDKECTSLELLYEIPNTSIINYIHWHPKLTSLSIHSSYIQHLANAIQNENWECRIESLSIIKGGDIEDDFESHLETILTHYNSISMQSLSFIDIILSEGIQSSLIHHIDLFYSSTHNYSSSSPYLIDANISHPLKNGETDYIESNTHLLKQIRLSDYKYNTIPFINLSFKRSAVSNENNKNSDDVLDLKMLYGVFIYMLYKSLHFTNGNVYEVFNCLDISEQIVRNEEYLVRIITKFKLIKELNISNTKIESNGDKLIESKRFLRYIKLDDNVDKVEGYMNVDKEKLYEIYEEEYEKWMNNELRNNESELGFDNCMGVYPILERIYLYNTEIKENVAEELYMLFKRLRYFQGIYFSMPFQNNQEHNMHIQTNVIENFIEEIHNDRKTYCENVFMLNNDNSI